MNTTIVSGNGMDAILAEISGSPRKKLGEFEPSDEVFDTESFGDPDSDDGVDLEKVVVGDFMDDVHNPVIASFEEILAKSVGVDHNIIDPVHAVTTHCNRPFLKTKLLMREFCASAKALSRQARVGITRFDEFETRVSTQDYRGMQVVNSVERRQEYIIRRNIEISGLYAQLGCQASSLSEANCFGSYQEVAQEAYVRRSEWTTTSVVSWLNSLVKGATNWSGVEHPYKQLLPYLPVETQSYLDYGCGSGQGAVQVAKYLGKPNIVHGYDVDNQLSDYAKNYPIVFRSNPVEQYQLVTMVNVLHHVDSAGPLLLKVMDTVALGGMLLIKDHFVNSSNVCLAVLVHEMYEPTTLGEEPDALYFRDLKRVIDFIRALGWTVDLREVPHSDVGDCVLICRNLRDGGRAQIVALEDKVGELTQEVAQLKIMVTQRFNNPKAMAHVPKKKSTARYNAVVANNDLSVPDKTRFVKPAKRPQSFGRGGRDLQEDQPVVRAKGDYEQRREKFRAANREEVEEDVAKARVADTSVRQPRNRVDDPPVESRNRARQVRFRDDEVIVETPPLKPRMTWVQKDVSFVPSNKLPREDQRPLTFETEKVVAKQFVPPVVRHGPRGAVG